MPGHAAGEHAGAIDDFGYGLFLAIGHDVHTVHTLDGADLLDELGTDLAALERLIGGTLQACNHRLGNVHAGHVRADPLGRLRRAQRTHADQDVDLLQYALGFHLVHETPQKRHVV